MYKIFLLFISILIIAIVGLYNCTDKSITMPDEKLKVEWQIQDVESQYGFLDVYFIDDRKGFIFGDGGLVLRTENGGDSWETMYENSEVTYCDISFPGENEGWMIALNNTHSTPFVLKSNDAGATWNELPPLNIYGQLDMLHNIYFIDNTTGWITNHRVSMDPVTHQLCSIIKILKTTDAGVSWFVQRVDTIVHGGNPIIGYHCLSFVDQNTGWISGCQLLVKTEDGGTTWIDQQQNIPSPPKPVERRHWWDVQFLDNNTGYLAARDEGVLKSDDGGNSWSHIFTGDSIPVIDAIHFVNHDLGVIAGNSVHITNNRGNSWELVYYNETHYFYDISFVNNNTIIAVGRSITDVEAGIVLTLKID